MPISRGFHRRHGAPTTGQPLPPGQYEVSGFPVLSIGPTPYTPREEWSFSIVGALDQPKSWSWEQFLQLPREEVTCDIHCVTHWSKRAMVWEGVPVDRLLKGVRTQARYVMAFSDGQYSTNLALEDVTGGRAWIALAVDGQSLPPEHGGPARLLVPHLYFWKSAKWIRGLRLMEHDEPGLWETLGYHNRGDPGREERYAGDRKLDLQVAEPPRPVRGGLVVAPGAAVTPAVPRG